MDYVTCGTGSYFDFDAIIPPSLYEQRLGEPFAAALKAVVRNAVVQAESHIRTPAAAEAVLAAGHADMVSIVRGQIADPHLVAKARAGHADEVRPCISCNQLCWGRRSRDYWISCLINPSAGREFEWGGDRFEPARVPRSVLVVGGGPAGLEAARVAAERGHRVTLVEAAPRLGGQFRLAGLQPSRGQILDLSPGTSGSLAPPRRRGPARRGDGAADVAAAVPTRSSWRPAHARRARASSARCRWSTGCPEWTRPTSSSIHAVLDGTADARTARARARRSRRLARPRDGAPPGRARPRGHARSPSAPVVARRPLPQRRRRPTCASATRWRVVAGSRRPPSSAGATASRRSRSTLTGEQTADRGRHARHRRDAGRGDRPGGGSARPGAAVHAIGDCVAPRRASLAFLEGRELALRL